jgi:hypothetical protein
MAVKPEIWREIGERGSIFDFGFSILDSRFYGSRRAVTGSIFVARRVGETRARVGETGVPQVATLVKITARQGVEIYGGARVESGVSVFGMANAQKRER